MELIDDDAQMEHEEDMDGETMQQPKGETKKSYEQDV